MDGFHTLQEFMTHTKGVVYLLIVATLIGLGGFWAWLSGRDKSYEETAPKTDRH